MGKKQYGPQYEKERKKQRALQRQVLEHLKKRGPSLYDGLYVLFDLNRSGNIGPALQHLKLYGSIEVDNDKMVTITPLGLDRLTAKDS